MITDSSGNVVWQWDNTDPFGNNIPNENPAGAGPFNFNLRFPGQYYDRETNLHYNINRDYDPSIGRYVQSDPIGLAGGINTYAYVNGNPLSYVDPWGLELVPINLPGLGDNYVDNAFKPKVEKFIQLAEEKGVSPQFNAAYRTPLKQLITKNGTNPRAKESLHSCGFAFDVNYSVLSAKERKILRGAAKDAGLEWGGSFSDPPHFYFDPGGRTEKISEASEAYSQFKRETRTSCNICERNR